MMSCKRMGFALLFAALLCLPVAASAGGKKKDACAKADRKLLLTGQGDSDGDGLSDCRESRYLGSNVNDPDSDDDGLDDGEDFHAYCDPLNPDSDHDGIEDGDDDSPAIKQKMEAILDAIVCPQPGVPGSISALGTTAVLDEATRFDDTTCAELAALLLAGTPPFVEIKILEDALGALTATKVEREDDDYDDDDDDDDDDDHEDWDD